MHFTDIIYLGWANLRSHFGRNLLTMGVIGTLFCLIFTAQLWLQGLQNQYITSAGAKTNGITIISASPQINDGYHFDENGNYIGTMLSLEEISEDITNNDGTIVNATATDDGIILPSNIIFGTPKSSTNDTTPILLSAHQALQLIHRECPQYSNSVANKVKFYQDVREQVIGQNFEQNGVKYNAIDLTSTNFCTPNLSFRNLDRKNTSIFNPLLELFPTPDGENIIIQNNTLVEENEYPQVFATFSNAVTAYRYLLNGHGYFSMIEIPGRKIDYNVTVLAGTSPEIIFVFKLIRFFLNIGCIVLAIIATITIIFTTIRLVDQNKHNIKLYHSFGATKGQIQLIYLIYFLELMIGAAIFSFGLASIITIIYSLCNQANLSALFMVGFSLAETPYVILWGINLEIITFMVTLFFLAPLSILVNRKRF